MNDMPQSGQQKTVTVGEAIELAIQYHNSGNLSQAEGIYQKILQIDPKHCTALHLLGLIAIQVGKNDIAIELVGKALAINPNFAEAHNNLGAALQGVGKFDDAVASYRKAISINPDYVEAYNNLGNVLQEMDKFDDAIASYRKALTINPDYVEAHSNLGNALQGVGKFDDAVASYRKAISINPEYAEVNYNLGNVLQEMDKFDDAIASYRKALTINPDYVEAHSNLGNALQGVGKFDDAVASYRKAISINPEYAEAHNNLCELLEASNNTEEMRNAVKDALMACPADPYIVLRKAQLLKREGNYIEARTILEMQSNVLIHGELSATRSQLLGDLCDRLGDTKAAFSYFKESNFLASKNLGVELSPKKQYLNEIDILTNFFRSDVYAGLNDFENINSLKNLVFLVGFPRSGTTLLDTILRSHGDVTVIEEKPMVKKVKEAVEFFPDGYPGSLTKVSSDNVAELRAIYLTELNKHLISDDCSSIIVDKMPLNAVDAGLIHRIFPEARFIFSQRHPCDCVLSCFMQNFKLNYAMVNFLDLEDAAYLYDKVISLWHQYNRIMPLNVHTVRYEDLIESFDETISSVLGFLDINWDEGVKDYVKTAHKRGRINTPSYDQVTQPIYRRAAGRWEQYREEMKPVMPVLLPWIDRLGYDL